MLPDERIKEEILSYINKWHNKGILKVALVPSTLFACIPNFLDWIKGTIQEYGLGLYIHVSETRGGS